MKPFNLEEAKAGKPVVTRNGYPAKVIYWDRKDEKYPIIALVDKDEDIFEYTIDGRFYPSEESCLDLFMASEKREGWMNIYKCNTYIDIRGGGIYHTKEDAISSKGTLNSDYITTIKIEWEE